MRNWPTRWRVPALQSSLFRSNAAKSSLTSGITPCGKTCVGCLHRPNTSLSCRPAWRRWSQFGDGGLHGAVQYHKAAVAVLPVLRVDPALDSIRRKLCKCLRRAAKGLRRWSSDRHWRTTSKVCNFMLYKTAYDAHTRWRGLPVGVQVVSRPYQEEKAIGIMRLLDDALPKPSNEVGLGRTS